MHVNTLILFFLSNNSYFLFFFFFLPNMEFLYSRVQLKSCVRFLRNNDLLYNSAVDSSLPGPEPCAIIQRFTTRSPRLELL